MKRVEEKRRRWLKRKVHIRKNLSGTPERPRMSVYRSNKHMYVQIIDDTTGTTLSSVSTVEPELREMKNTVENGIKIGEIAGKRLAEKQIREVVFDRNGYLYHGIVKSIADGARKAGIKF